MNNKKLSNKLRLQILKMSNKTGAPHVASALSCLDIVTALYNGILKTYPKNPKNKNRDRFILSKGHAATAQYVNLAHKGFISKKKLNDYTLQNSHLEEHPNPSINGVEAATGSLGHGLPIGCGIALAAKIKKKKYKTVVLLGDGECNEGTIWESALFASSKILNNLYVIVDNNGWQGIGRNKDILNLNPLKKKWESFGWETYVINGHKENQLKKIFEKKNAKRPVAIIAKTIKGKGISFMEDDNNWHYRIPSKNEILLAKKELK